MAAGKDDRDRKIEPGSRAGQPQPGRPAAGGAAGADKAAPQEGYAQGEMGGAKSGPAAESEGASEAADEFGQPQSAGYGGYGGGDERHGTGGAGQAQPGGKPRVTRPAGRK